MQQADRQLVTFALTICLTCSILLSAIAAGLRDRQEREVELDRKMNVLIAFGVDTRDERGRRISGEEVDAIFASNIREIILDADGNQTDEEPDPVAIRERRQLPLYLWEEDGEVKRYAFPTSGQGLWSTIYGFLALERDLATIAGITFFRHGETPGLGGEVDRDWFTDQFRGKKLFDDGEPVQFRVVQGGVSSRYPDGNPHAVDGISGATVTGVGVARFISEDFKRYNQFFEQIRGA